MPAEPRRRAPDAVEHRRAPEQTFLAFPRVIFIGAQPCRVRHLSAGCGAPPANSLLAHIGQFWQAYSAVTNETRAFPFNASSTFMISVIGASTTVEYGMKGVYKHA